MKYTHLTQRDYVVSHWSGGKTTQLAIFPEGAVYADRDFIWRISSATAEIDESDYTALPDYERLIAVFDRPIRLQHDGGGIITLQPYDVHRFDGAAATHSWGRCVDFNLMLRKGRAEGEMRALTIDGKAEIETANADTLLIYCAEGEGQIASVAFGAGEAVLLAEIDESRFAMTGHGRFMLVRVRD